MTMEEKRELIKKLMDKRMGFMQRGETIKEVDVLKELAQLIVEVHGEESDENIKILNEIGGTLKYVGEFERAEKSLLKARDIIERKYGKNNVSYATCTLNLAEVYRFMKKFDETENMYILAKEIYEKNNLHRDYVYASLCNNFGLFYQEQNRYEMALELHKKSLEILENDPKQKLQYATTLSNLVIPYLKTGNREKSNEYLKKSLKLIEEVVGKEHNLYSASLNNLAISYFEDGEYERALELFEESAIICKKAFGENSNNYKNLLSNINFVREKLNLDKGEKNDRIKGIELSREYFNEVYKPFLEKEFPDLYKRMAVGLVGEGSECFGFDDEVSIDHDFGPSCCIWITREDYDKFGKGLEQSLERLPKDFKGFNALRKSEFGDGRRGVLIIEDWYYKFLGRKNVPETFTDWRIIPETALSTATNGEIFVDNLGEFTKIRNGLLEYYPEDIRKNKIATRCMKMAQSGQYNVPRSIKRKKMVAARMAENEFITEFIHMIYLLNKKYLIFYKWSHEGLKNLEILGEKSYEIVEKIINSQSNDEKINLIERACRLVIEELKKQGIVTQWQKSDFLQDVGIEVQSSILDEKLRKWSPALD